ncbi:MAG: sugar ABC transporter permease [Betaproteobacteria bacterium]|nr:sugar ABC transporter permease [Betaproteobacteria bacterium]
MATARTALLRRHRRRRVALTPFVFLLMLAGLESLPTDVYEAAWVDGATFWQELRHVTLPLMLPAIVVTLVFRLISQRQGLDDLPADRRRPRHRHRSRQLHDLPALLHGRADRVRLAMSVVVLVRAGARSSLPGRPPAAREGTV